VAYAATLARQHKAQLTLVHVVNPKELAGVPDQAIVVQVVRRNLADLAASKAGLQPGLRVEVGRVAPTILQTADEIKADLLVMSVRPSIGVLNRLVWPNAYEVVREAPCPVLTLREPN